MACAKSLDFARTDGVIRHLKSTRHKKKAAVLLKGIGVQKSIVATLKVVEKKKEEEKKEKEGEEKGEAASKVRRPSPRG